MASWLSPVLIALSGGLLARAHYVLYALKRGNRTSAIITWVATILVAGFWAWKLFAALECGGSTPPSIQELKS